MNGSSSQKIKDALIKDRKTTADDAYAAARGNAGPVDVTGASDSIDDALRSNTSIDGGLTGLSDTALGKRLDNIKKQISTGDFQSINFDDVLATKQELGRAIEVMKRKGGVPPQVAEVMKQLDTALENSSSAYRAANDGFRESSRVIDAVDQTTPASPY